MGRIVVAYLVAVIVTHILASLFHTQFILAELTGMGVAVDWATRVQASLDDFIGLTASVVFPAIIAIGLLIAFVAAGFVARLAPGLRWFVFFVAGAVAMAVIFMLLKQALGTVGLFGARGTLGLAAQCLAGAVGGLVFATLKPAVR